MPFTWDSIRKNDEVILQQIIEDVREYVMNFYSVSEISDLTQAQIDEVGAFFETLDDASLTGAGFNAIFEEWDEANS